MGTYARRAIAALLMALTLLTASLLPASANYGATDAIVWYDVGISDAGCSMSFYVYQGKKAQVFCTFVNPVNGVKVARTNYTEFDCPDASLCYYQTYINGVGGSYPTNMFTMMKDDIEGDHTIIMDIGH